MTASIYTQLICLILLGVNVFQKVGAAVCPCSNPVYCAPLQIPSRSEIFGFMTDATNFPYYPLDIITSIVNFAGDLDPQVICTAHAAGVKVHGNAPYPKSQLHNSTFLSEFIQSQIESLQTNFYDGVNFDFEDPLDNSNGDADALTNVISSTAAALKSAIAPFITISVDVAWSPNCIDLRCYNYAGIANVSDILFVMAYDMRSQVFWPNPCIASANSPLPSVFEGMSNWTNLGVDSSKLILGVPWYGYFYTCLSPTGSTDAYCPIERVTWRGVNCSDAVGKEYAYSDVMLYLKNNATKPRTYNSTLQAPFFDFIDSNNGNITQVWYDDPLSLQVKYDAAKASNWLGVGMWNLDLVDYKSTDEQVKEETKAMWEAISSFRR